jgi:ABC-type oligopeptide transport system substrate-binding subunit
MVFDVFISHSNKDKAVADAAVAHLEGRGIRCWVAPRDITPGADWGQEIASAIKQCRIFLLIFSNHSNRSQRVLDELNLAISREATILPFRIENIDPVGAMQLHLASRHWLDAYDPSWKAHLDSLAETISGILGIRPKEQPQAKPSTQIREKKPSSKKLRPFFLIPLGAVGILVALGIIFYPSLFPGKTSPNDERTGIVPTLTGIPSSPANLDIAIASSQVDLDPLYLNYIDSTFILNSLFLTLTDIDITNGKVVPEAAESWSISTDGRIYTFKIRQDIPWVNHALGGTTDVERDENGNIRYLNADDFVYAIHRMCNPDKDPGAYDSLLVPLIKGCLAVYQYPDPKNVPANLFDSIGTRALSTYELFIELEAPASFFLAVTSMHPLAATPQWAIEKYQTAWNSPGILVSDGLFVIDQFSVGEAIQFARNEFLPEDMLASGNIKRINLQLGKDENQVYDLWLAGKVDFAPIPLDQFISHKEKYPSEIVTFSGETVVYAAFNTRKAPFDNVHVRRAFSAAFYRETYVNQAIDGLGVPMIHIGLPGVNGAPPVNEAGVGYDPAFAKEELALAGYPDCAGFPTISIQASRTTSLIFRLPEETIRTWETTLGCPAHLFQEDFTSEPDKQNVDILVGGWTYDYPDENSMLYDLFYCEYTNSDWIIFKRSCNSIDDLLKQAQTQVDQDERAALYYQAEEALFGKDGEFPVAPIYMRILPYAVQPWLTINLTTNYERSSFKGWIINMEDKTSAGEN